MSGGDSIYTILDDLTDNHPMPPRTRPLFSVDPGWLFVAAGVVLMAAGVLIPAKADLNELRDRLERLKAAETTSHARLRAHAEFLDSLNHGDPMLLRRMAAAQLNLMPEGDKPILLAETMNMGVSGWIDAALQPAPPRRDALSRASQLSRWCEGEARLWLLGGAAFCVFIGLIVAPIRSSVTPSPTREDSRETETSAADLNL